MEDLQDKIYIALDDISNYASVKKLSNEEFLTEILDNISTKEILKKEKTFNKKIKHSI